MQMLRAYMDSAFAYTILFAAEVGSFWLLFHCLLLLLHNLSLKVNKKYKIELVSIVQHFNNLSFFILA